MSMTPKQKLLEEARRTLLELTRFMGKVGNLKDYPNKDLEDQLELESFVGVRQQLELWLEALKKEE